MANKLEKFYSKFGGIDSRSNKLLQDPGTFRKGSKNFRYDFQDQIINAQGFQHKDNSAPNFVDIFEYKYRDVNTGASQVQVLGVATDGHLYKRLETTFSFSTHGSATFVSVFYDEIDDTFRMELGGLGVIDISQTMTLADLEIAANLLIGSPAISITGDSSKLAYLLDCVIEDATFAPNTVYYWEKIFFGGSLYPFPTTYAYHSADDYEGISSVNLNNAIYITDGGFPMKYDGKAVYRIGMPKVLMPNGAGTQNASNFLISGASSTGGNLVGGKTYAYKFRFGFINQAGEEILGDLQTNPQTSQNFLYAALGAPQNSYTIAFQGLKNGPDFPVYAVKCNGSGQNIPTAGGTINVLAGHNIQVGMCLRIPVSNAPLGFGGYSYIISRVSAVNTIANTITLEKGLTGGINPWGATNLLLSNQVLNGYWTQASLENTITDPNYNPSVTGSVYHPPTPLGAFIRVYRCKADTKDVGPFYELIDLPLPLSGMTSSFTDLLADTNLLTEFVDDEGMEIPRACKYLSNWQNNIVQSGRPVNPTIATNFYPSYGFPSIPVSYWGTNSTVLNSFYITEALLCDYQSIYWADSLIYEGFPQDGLHEFTIETFFADKIKGMAPNKDAFFVLKERSTAVLTGDVAENSISMEVLETDAGCVSHKSIKEIRGNLIWLDNVNGFFSCIAGRLPENIGFPIQDYQKINAEKLDYSKATATNFRTQSLYICSVGTTTFVFDYADNGDLKRNCWYIWDRINGKSVLATSDSKMLIWDGTRTWKMKLTNTKYDFTDHTEAIPMVLKTAWMGLGFPIIDKHFVALWINSIQGDFTLTVKQYGNYLEDLLGTQNNISFIAESSAKKFIKASCKAILPKLSSISWSMENEEKNKAVKIQGYELQYSADFDSGEPKR